MHKKTAVGLLVVAIGLTMLASVKVYFIRTQASGDLLWEADDAYIFLNITQRGYRISYLRYPFEFVKEYFGGVPTPDDKRSYVTVLRVSADGVQQYTINDLNLGTINVFEHNLYASDLDKGALLKWTESHFGPATSEQQEKLRKNINSLPPPNFSNVDGWSEPRGPPNGTFVVQLAARPFTFLTKVDNSQGVASIDLTVPGRSPERIWSLSDHLKRVSKDEYHRCLESH